MRPSQVLAYLVGLAKAGHRISLVTFEKSERSEIEGKVPRSMPGRRDRLASADLHQDAADPFDSGGPKRYEAGRRAAGARAALRHRALPRLLLRTGRARLNGTAGTKFLFDMRGFWADALVDGGLWDLAKLVYRAVYG